MSESSSYPWRQSTKEMIEARKGRDEFFECPACGEQWEEESDLHYHNRYASDECPAIDEYVVQRLQGQFGLIKPSDSGVIYNVQTAGHSCRQKRIEGVYIPLERPTMELVPYEETQEAFEESNFEDFGNFLDSTNYYGRVDLIERFKRRNMTLTEVRDDQGLFDEWRRIYERLPINYIEAVQPNGQHTSNEGFQWIEVTDALSRYQSLIGENVVLTYPNSD